MTKIWIVKGRPTSVNSQISTIKDTSRKQKPPINGHQTVVPAISLLKLYISNFS